MLIPRSATLKISNSANARLREDISSIAAFRAVPLLMAGRHRGESSFRWIVSYHDAAFVEGEDYQGLMFEVSGVRIVIPLEHERLLVTLNEAIIEMIGDKIEVVDADTGKVITWQHI